MRAMMFAGLVVAVFVVGGSAAQGQVPKVPAALDAMFVFVFKEQACAMAPSPGQASAMEEVGGLLQERAGLSDADMDAAFAKATAGLPAPDCTAFEGSMQSEIDRLTAIGKRALGG